MKSFDHTMFREKLLCADVSVNHKTTTDEYARQLYNNVTWILDNLVPYKTTTKQRSKPNVLLDENVKAVRRDRCRSECRFQTSVI